MNSPKPRLTQGPVGGHLVDMTVPVLLGIATMMAQGLVDTWFIGKVGDAQLAAFSFGFPILMIVTSVAIGLGAGTSSVVARAIGADDQHRARRLSTDSLLLSFLVTAIISAIGILTIGPLFRLLGAPDELMPLIRGFMTILYMGVPFIVVGMVGMASMRATGDTRLPSMLMILAAVLNVILDPILIFGVGPLPAMGLNGAAMAALLARASIFVGTLYLMRHRLDMVTFDKPDPGELRRSWRDILHVGIPAAGTNVIVPVGAAVVTAMIARFGPDAVAGFGVASRIESMMLVMYYALSAIIGPFVGQNFSAGKEDRILRALWLCTAFCIGSGLVIAGLLASMSGWLPGLFSDSESVRDVTSMFLWLVPVSYGTYGMVMVMNASFNGLGYPMPGVIISVCRIAVLYIPAALIAMRFFDIAGIFAAYAIANIVSGLGAYAWARSAVRHRCAEEAVLRKAPAEVRP
ncbi:MAG: MATE family efflux transporter [Gammaproteobacteria bacterium]|nr:MATE family efflux transporter [Gammaproteobacteria bacterium]MDH3756931.1 MATE family efflux transporter [Gammaproteobacteria bacterium]MDH3847527.1 MATE family efflux transporter [Gammaproteobacteria bacterium]MDH3862428.1 MATE family efflux transporter [Gammaproteobacteria bacterium]MDH3904486.1 MATE family efflux transporter [Gammaproteobacteria bacterium]